MKVHLISNNSSSANVAKMACGKRIGSPGKFGTRDLDKVTCLSCMQTNEYDMREEQGSKQEFVEENYVGPDMNPPADPEDQSATDKQVGGAWYKKFTIQPIEFVMQNEDALHPTDAFMLNNVLKYCLRHREKNGVEDLEKAIHYIELVKEHTYEEET